jgi:hypothetical protein
MHTCKPDPMVWCVMGVMVMVGEYDTRFFIRVSVLF